MIGKVNVMYDGKDVLVLFMFFFDLLGKVGIDINIYICKLKLVIN